MDQLTNHERLAAAALLERIYALMAELRSREGWGVEWLNLDSYATGLRIGPPERIRLILQNPPTWSDYEE